MKSVVSSLLITTLALAAPAMADDRPGHFEGRPAESLEQAVANFSEYNARLAEILEKSELSAEDLHAVHRITYTLENALYRIEEEMEEIEETLEEVHVASENADAATVHSSGRRYLKASRQIIK